jgi:HEAT repeat protein
MGHELTELIHGLVSTEEMPEQRLLYCLSNLDDPALGELCARWTALPVGLRRDLAARLVDLAEADFEVDFRAVFRLCLGDSDAEVRTSGVEGLWEDEDLDLIPVLSETLIRDPSARVRAAAATSLGRFVLLGELDKIRPNSHRRAIAALLSAYSAETATIELKRRALESLAYSSERNIPDLIAEAYRSGDERMRVSAVFAMGRSGDSQWKTYVQGELFSANPELRYEAARACGELQLADTVGSLRELADDVDPEVRETALWSLGQIGGADARAVLEQYCESEDDAARSAAQSALNELEFLFGDLDAVLNQPVLDDDD